MPSQHAAAQPAHQQLGAKPTRLPAQLDWRRWRARCCWAGARPISPIASAAAAKLVVAPQVVLAWCRTPLPGTTLGLVLTRVVVAALSCVYVPPPARCEGDRPLPVPLPRGRSGGLPRPGVEAPRRACPVPTCVCACAAQPVKSRTVPADRPPPELMPRGLPGGPPGLGGVAPHWPRSAPTCVRVRVP